MLSFRMFRRGGDKHRAAQFITKLAAGVCMLGVIGCQYQPVAATQLQNRQSRLVHDGLLSIQIENRLKISCAPPGDWHRMITEQTLLYAHQQWRSPSKHAGMGVVYVHSLLPLSSDMVLWFAQSQYRKNKKPDGHEQMVSLRVDGMQRHWFEAENETYHVKGYAMTHGQDAWIVYSGWKLKTPPPTDEIAQAEQAVETVAPLVDH